MKILRDGKEVKDAKVIYNAYGGIDVVQVEGVSYDPKAFEFEEPKVQEKTKGSEEGSKPAKKVAKKSK